MARRTLKPKVSDLRNTYRKIVSVTVTARVMAMMQALAWWDVYISYMLHKHGAMNAQQANTFRRANMARNLALNTNVDGEKETALYQTIKQYERLWDADSIPSIEDAYAAYDAQRARLETAERKIRERYQVLVDLLGQAFSTFSLTFTVAKGEKAHSFDGNKTVTLSVDHASALLRRLRSSGPLSVLFAEAPIVLRASGVERDEHGNHALNPRRVLKNLSVMFSGLEDYCYSFVAENKAAKLIRKADAQSTTTQSTRSTTKRRAPRKSSGPKVAGRYTPGSALAEYFKILVDGEFHTYQELQSAFYVKFPKDTVWYIKDHGKKNGRWTVTQSKGGAQMDINDQTVHQEIF